MQEDIYVPVSDTRPPMLDRTDFESWQQRIRLYCLGKDNGENIMKSIKEGPFHMGTVSDVITGGTEGAVQQGPVRARVLNDLSAEEKERGLKESNFDQLYAYLKQHEVHANENKIMMERFIQPNNDPLALVSDASVQQYPTQSSKSPQPSKEPSPADNFQLDSGSSSIENLIESLSNTLALLTQSYKSHLPQTNNQLRRLLRLIRKTDFKETIQEEWAQARECPRPKRLQDSDYFKDKMLLMQAQESGAVLDEEQSLFLAGEQVTNVDDDVDDST
ncbi:hypothetical protein Tco_0210685 [Tanacetum coccineum]